MSEDATFGGRLAPEAWSDSYRTLLDTPREQLGAEDLEVLAVSAYLIGDDDTSAEAWEAAHDRHVDAGTGADAARCSFWLAFCLMLRGQMAHAGAWLGRTQALIEDECAASGYLLVPDLLGALEAGDAETARDMAIRATGIATDFGDWDLGAFSTLGHGQALIALGDAPSGLAKLDEAMLSVESGKVGPIASGIVYCAVILECMQLFDFGRAREWTDALDAWCQAQPDLIPYRGQCMVHQSELQQAAGDWPKAATTVANACARLEDPPHPALGLAYYQMGELNRLSGSFPEAAEAYARASQAGCEPMPGLALLSLARGEIEAASASIRRALAEANQPFQRSRLLGAAVEVFRAAGDRQAAGDAAAELASLVADSSSKVLVAVANRATGSVKLDDGNIADALTDLRSSAASFRGLDMPYEVARTGVLIGLACSVLGDTASANLELETSRATFASLGAEPDEQRVSQLAGTPTTSTPTTSSEPSNRAGLSHRELEVLANVAAGKTNPEIAAELTISQHTVGRHLENIFAKLGVNSRAAATAHAYENNLL